MINIHLIIWHAYAACSYCRDFLRLKNVKNFSSFVRKGIEFKLIALINFICAYTFLPPEIFHSDIKKVLTLIYVKEHLRS